MGHAKCKNERESIDDFVGLPPNVKFLLPLGCIFGTVPTMVDGGGAREGFPSIAGVEQRSMQYKFILKTHKNPGMTS